ncbi:MAG: hypothetical protein R3F13_18355 [Prosthecobacter sp.]
MHPHAPSRAPVALMDQAEVARMMKRRGKPRLSLWIRGLVILTAITATTAGVMWFVHETPHVDPSEATRESAVVEARSLKPFLETHSVPLAPYAMNRQTSGPQQELTANLTALPSVIPPWLVADGARSADLLRQELRKRGAMQMGQTVRMGMLKVDELLALDDEAWREGMTTMVATENETSALLLTFYLHHLDGAGDAAGVNAMRREIESGMPQDQAVRKFILAGLTPAEFENRMGRAYASVGIELQFTRRGGAVFEP